MEYYNYYDFFVAFLLPLTLIITLNTVTACAVWKPNKFGRNIKDNNRYVRFLSYTYTRNYPFVLINQPHSWAFDCVAHSWQRGDDI